MTVHLRVVEDQDAAAEVRGDVGLLLGAGFAEAPYNRAPGDVDEMLARFDRHSRKAGFRLVLALDDGTPVGCAYGYRLPANTGWWADVLEPVPADVSREDGQRTFVLFELAVAPGRRREHLGTRVHAELLEGRPERRVVLNVRQDAGPARGAYTAWGYRRATSVVPWPGAPVYDVMVRDL